jgi:hypothetical protein
MLKPAPYFAARPGVAGLRALLEAPPDAPGTGAPTPVAAPSIKDEVVKILREELPKPLAEHLEKQRTESVEKITKLDERLNKLDSDFARIYEAAKATTKPNEAGLIERELMMRPHESVDEYIERHRVTTGRVTSIGGSPMGGGRGRRGLEGVRDQRGITARASCVAFAAAARKNSFRGGDLWDDAAQVASKRVGRQAGRRLHRRRRSSARRLKLGQRGRASRAPSARSARAPSAPAPAS